MALSVIIIIVSHSTLCHLQAMAFLWGWLREQWFHRLMAAQENVAHYYLCGCWMPHTHCQIIIITLSLSPFVCLFIHLFVCLFVCLLEEKSKVTANAHSIMSTTTAVSHIMLRLSNTNKTYFFAGHHRCPRCFVWRWCKKFHSKQCTRTHFTSLFV